MHPLRGRWLKLSLIVAGTAILVSFTIQAALNGLAVPWVLAAGILLALYAQCGYTSFGRRGRWIGTIGALALTGVVAGITFFHLWLVGAGLLVSLGCAWADRDEDLLDPA